MSLRDGLGDVINTDKNIQLITYEVNNPEHEKFKCSEKITAVRADDCSSIWVITHFVDTFYAFKIEENGISRDHTGQPISIKSTVGPTVPIEGYRRNALGYMKASPDANKIVVAHSNFATTFGGGAPGGVYLFDFDNETGIVSNSIELLSPTKNGSPYGVEFSSESNRVYATVNFNSVSQVLQWNLEHTDIPSSEAIVHSSTTFSVGALQLGIDKRIYRAQLNFNNFSDARFLGVINDPDEIAGNAFYNENGVLLDVNVNGQNLARIGLPPFIQSLFNTEIDIVQNGESTTTLNLCEGETFPLMAETVNGLEEYRWFKDDNETPLSMDGVGNSLNLRSNRFVVQDSGFYRVEIEPNNGECPIQGSARVNISALPVANNAILTQCDLDGDGFTRFNLNEVYNTVTASVPNLDLTFFAELPSDINATSIPLNANDYENNPLPQTITVRVTNPNTGCESFAMVTLQTRTEISKTFNLDTCDNDGLEDGRASFTLANLRNEILNGLPTDSDVVFYEHFEDALLETLNMRLNENEYTSESKIIYARVENNNSCASINDVNLIVNDLPTLLSNSGVIYCLNNFPETITLNSGLINANPNNFSYNWSNDNANTTPSIEVNQLGNYTVGVTNNNTMCFKERTITVNASNIASIDNIVVNDAANNNTINILVSGEGDYEFALGNINGPYQDSNIFEDVKGGIYTIYVRDKNDCGITSEDVSVISFPKFFTPNNDSINDFWQVQGISHIFQPNTIVYIFDKYGKLLKELNPLGQGWDGTFNGQIMPNDDYWFKITLQDGRLFSSHFALRR